MCARNHLNLIRFSRRTRITGGVLPKENQHHETALLCWLSHVCAALKRRIDQEIESGAIDENVIHFLPHLLSPHLRSIVPRAEAEAYSDCEYEVNHIQIINLLISPLFLFLFGFCLRVVVMEFTMGAGSSTTIAKHTASA